MKVLVDMDGTLNSFTPHFIAFLEREGYHFDSEGYYDNEIFNCENYIIEGDTEKKKKKIMSKIFSIKEFWLTLPVLPYAVETMRRLNGLYELYIATIPYKATEKYKDSKSQWLRKYFKFITPQQILFTSHKETLDGDVIIDDKPEILEACSKVMLTVVKDCGYNKSITTDFRFSDWRVVPSILKKAEKALKS